MRIPGPKNHAPYKNVRVNPSIETRIPLEDSPTVIPRFAILVKIEYCVAPTFGFVISISKAESTQYCAPWKTPIIP